MFEGSPRRKRGGRPLAGRRRGPARESDAAAHDRRLARIRGVDDRNGRGAGIGRRQRPRGGQGIGAVADEHLDWRGPPRPRNPSHRRLGAPQRLEGTVGRGGVRCRQSSGPGIVAVDGHEEVGGHRDRRLEMATVARAAVELRPPVPHGYDAAVESVRALEAAVTRPARRPACTSATAPRHRQSHRACGDGDGCVEAHWLHCSFLPRQGTKSVGAHGNLCLTVSTPANRSPRSFTRSITVRMVNRVGSSSSVTSSHVTGVDTTAPSRARMV